eukprot:CAMPEP_0119055428 /NCGR_PEP_ID=MMETSP1177-20130426/75704_1 /TAXON_ID=2985 /ORGANISM="Ochromonas sp, Strain CCMP1899" /LENGTH=312 /DNA_ID=CAMNT_0007035951 /DNA_START=2607 /DNA_END=3545 /DNA_ORIENTATION=+
MIGWIESARKWQEMWSEETNDWFYFNAETGESFWEPTRGGYKKVDGRLVLSNGAVVKDPAAKKDGDEDEYPTDICSECNERFSIRACKECGDNFCTPCYKILHASGTRQNHTYSQLGPLDCSECERNLAERWCVTCDEGHCDLCWRKLHSKSKRRFHPFCKVFPGGRVGTVMTTIDGQEVSNSSYDATYAQQRSDNWPATEGFGEEIVEYTGEKDPWIQATDDQGYEYYFNESTGISQYENPYETAIEEYDPNQSQNYDDPPILALEDSNRDNSQLLALTDGNDWEEAYDDDGYKYFYNSVTNISQYEDPNV